MRKRQFEEAVERLRRQGYFGITTEADGRVFAAAGFILRYRLGIPDDEPWTPTDAALAEFLAGLNPAQREALKSIADDLQIESASVADDGANGGQR